MPRLTARATDALRCVPPWAVLVLSGLAGSVPYSTISAWSPGNSDVNWSIPTWA